MRTILLLLSIFYFVDVNSQCNNVSANSSSSQLTYTFLGGSFQSFGCAPIDPTYWMSGNGMSVTVTFTTPQDYPRFRVWGMNTDDVASITVNNTSYYLNSSTAAILPKVVCGISPGPDGVVFNNGNVTGANTPFDGNYSYNDIQLTTTGVTSFTITGISGAGWGFASTIINCPLSNNSFDWNSSISIYSKDLLAHIDIDEKLLDAELKFYDLLGKEIINSKLIDLQNTFNLNKGIYLIKINKENVYLSKKIVIN